MTQPMIQALVAVLTTFLGSITDRGRETFDDAAFLRAAATGGRYDARLCDLVGSETRDARVRELAATVVVDRFLSGPELKKVAEGAGVDLPADLDDAHRKRYEAFKRSAPADRDRAFVRAVVERHTKAVVMFTVASKQAKDPAVRAFATETLPVLRKRLESAKALDE